jgi:hypothetical protein
VAKAQTRFCLGFLELVTFHMVLGWHGQLRF